MSTDFYLRLKRPLIVETKDPYTGKVLKKEGDNLELQIGLRSGGWQPLFYAYSHPAEGSFEPVIKRVQDIRNLLASGKWEVVDEYRTVYTAAEFEEALVKWGQRQEAFPHPRFHSSVGNYGYFFDKEGYEFYELRPA